MKIVREGLNEPVDNFTDRRPDRVYVKVPIKAEVSAYQPTLEEYLANGWKLETDDPQIVKARNTAIVSIEKHLYEQSKEYFRRQGIERVFSENYIKTSSPYITPMAVEVTEGEPVALDSSKFQVDEKDNPPSIKDYGAAYSKQTKK
jgi:hypothetical protein